MNTKENVIFIHNVFDRNKTLLKTIEYEKKEFLNSIFIITMHKEHDKHSLDHLLKKQNINAIILSGDLLGHKKGCLNSFIIGLKYVLENQLKGTIIFSHDDVYLKKPQIFHKNLKILNESKNISFILKNTIWKGQIDLYSIECIYLKNSLLKIIYDDLVEINEENEIPKDPITKSPSPELWLSNLFKSKEISGIIHNVYEEDLIPIYKYNRILEKALGYHHKNIGSRNWRKTYFINKAQIKSWIKWITD
jgi:hypothetical protein